MSRNGRMEEEDFDESFVLEGLQKENNRTDISPLVVQFEDEAELQSDEIRDSNHSNESSPSSIQPASRQVILQQQQRRASAASSRSITKTQSLRNVCLQFETLVQTKNHRFRMKSWPDTFVGSEAVDLMIQAKMAYSRKDAVKIGRALCKRYNLFQHCTQEHDFKDDYLFYCYVEPSQRWNWDYGGSESFDSSGNFEMSITSWEFPPALKSQNLEMFARAFCRGILVKNHWYRAKLYQNVFVGSEAVDYMVNSSMAVNRKDAIQLGRTLATEMNLFVHVTDGHEFKDDYLFYRYTNEQQRFLDNNANDGNEKVVLSMERIDTATKLVAQVSLDSIAETFTQVVEVSDHHYHGKMYSNVFVGQEAVDALISIQLAESREEAVQIGRALAHELGLFEHVRGAHEFKDEYLFYKYSSSNNNIRSSDLTPEKKPAGALMNIARDFEAGIKLGDNWAKLKLYRNSFVGKDAVNYILERKWAETRSQAVRLGRDMASEFNLFQHVKRRHDFKDQYLIYQFVDENKRRLARTTSETLNISKLSRIASAVEDGVKVKSHRHLFRIYRNTFLGREMVDFMVDNHLADSREQAVELGRALARRLNLFQHVLRMHELMDKRLIYRFVPAEERRSVYTREINLDARDLETIAIAFEDNMEVGNHVYHMRNYRDTFVGSEAVDFMIESHLADSREHAVTIGLTMQRRFNLFEHVYEDHEFKDAYLFYRFVPEAERFSVRCGEIMLDIVKLEDIACSFESGVEAKDHKIRLLSYPKTFTGTEAVDFLVDTKVAESRKEAVHIGRTLARRFSLFYCLTRGQELEDDGLLYRFVKHTDQQSFSGRSKPCHCSQPQQKALKMGTTGTGRSAITGLEALADLSEFGKYERVKEWASEFRRTDPRFQILSFFNDVSQEGAEEIEESGINPILVSPLLRHFYRAAVFTVWRPTSYAAIRKMMLGEAVGKGLDIKGKSAKRGKLSALVPFLQITENHDKRMIRSLPKDGKVRLFFPQKASGRDSVAQRLQVVAEEMVEAVEEAKRMLTDETVDDETRDDAFETMAWEMTDPTISIIDEYAPQSYGLEIPVRLLWETYVVRQDISRKRGSEYDTGRPSQPAFQDMNFAALRNPPMEGVPRAVLYQYNDADCPMCPFNLVMAYEEHGRVLPVVSDFDCFLVGTRGVSFSAPLPEDQLGVLKWCVSNIEKILDGPSESRNWTGQWLEVLKDARSSGFHPEIPRYGFGDPRSYSIMAHAIGRLVRDGAVRHGAECFNYYFPQDLDEEFLVISDSLPGNVAWQYVNRHELQEILSLKIDEGFTFPLNPKWVLCDPGWKVLYDKIMRSDKANVQDSLRVWYPLDSGIREQIEAVATRHPDGFRKPDSTISMQQDGTGALDLALLELKRYERVQRAKKKLRGVLFWIKLLAYVRKKRAAKEGVNVEVNTYTESLIQASFGHIKKRFGGGDKKTVSPRVINEASSADRRTSFGLEIIEEKKVSLATASTAVAFSNLLNGSRAVKYDESGNGGEARAATNGGKKRMDRGR